MIPTKNENNNGTHGVGKSDTSISVSISSANVMPTDVKNPMHDALISFNNALLFFDIFFLMLLLMLLLACNNDADDFQNVDRQWIDWVYAVGTVACCGFETIGKLNDKAYLGEIPIVTTSMSASSHFFAYLCCDLLILLTTAVNIPVTNER